MKCQRVDLRHIIGSRSKRFRWCARRSRVRHLVESKESVLVVGDGMIVSDAVIVVGLEEEAFS